jgi:microcin C transport system ATP-binding protein
VNPPLLSIQDLRLAFATPAGEREVLRGVGFDVPAGGRVALVGESGSGKSITALAILGLLDREGARQSGSIRFEGEDLLHASEARLRALRGRSIGMIFQEPMSAFNPLHTVGRQVAETLLVHEGLTEKAARERAIELLALTGIRDPEQKVDAFPHQLSGGQRQRAMIAMALACRPRLLIADEPTTALDVTLQAQILELLARLQREMGMAVLMITHDLPLVRRFAEQVVVMRQGEVVEQGGVEDVFSEPAHDYTRLLLESAPVRDIAQPRAQAAVLEARAVRCVREGQGGGLFRRAKGQAILHGIDLALRAGETLGVVGESGSGKTTLAHVLLRLLAGEGEIKIDGVDWQALRGETLRRARRSAQVVFQDPFAALSPRMTIEQIVGEGLRVHEPGLDNGARRARVIEALEEVGLGADMLWRYPHEFSGGQRQRIAIARALVLRPRLMVLDEPTSALDVSVQKQVLTLLQDLQRRHGLSYLLITHDLRVIRAMAHRVIVLKEGRVVEEGETLDLLANSREAYTRELVEAAGLLQESA